MLISHRQADLLDAMKYKSMVGKRLRFAPTLQEETGDFGEVGKVDSKGITTTTGKFWGFDEYKIHGYKNFVWLVLK